jgi:hypothetical protein
MSIYKVEVECLSYCKAYSKLAFYSVAAESDVEAMLIASQMAACGPVELMPIKAELLDFPIA